MNRTFQARINFGQCLFLLLATGVSVWALWHQLVLLALFFVLLVVVAIERLIHTTYTFTPDTRLLVCKGRFSKQLVLNLGEIDEVRQVHYLRLGRWRLMHGISLRHHGQQYETLMPANEDEFLKVLRKRMEIAENLNKTI